MTNYDRIKTMSKEDLTELLDEFVQGGIASIENTVCKKCKAEHKGKCVAAKYERCVYPYDSYMILEWLDLEATT